ncbi:MAG: hypothetical protein M1294_08685 [Firmicutes bacterium]|nr:hypothetical protein [Bacillota bacterium]
MALVSSLRTGPIIMVRELLRTIILCSDANEERRLSSPFWGGWHDSKTSLLAGSGRVIRGSLSGGFGVGNPSVRGLRGKAWQGDQGIDSSVLVL